MKPDLASAESVRADPGFADLKWAIIDFTGLAYYGDKESILADRLLKRWEATGVSDCRSYLDLLQKPGGGQEFDALAVELTIGETYFFRHEEHFKALSDVVLPDLIRKNQNRRQLRIWSAGCAIGAEAYSLSVLLKREFQQELEGWQIQIVGTDINRRFLAQAMEARFDEWALRGMSAPMRDACFTPQGKSWVLAPRYKEGVSFEYHNLIKNPFPSLLQNLAAFDLILCRNAMIYFHRDVNRRLARQFHQTLVEGGWLLVGYAESDRDLFKDFRPADVAEATLFQKIPVVETPAAPDPVIWTAPALADGPLHRITDRLPDIPPEAVPDITENPLTPVRQLADEGRWEEALNCCEELMVSERLNPSLHYYRALIHEQMGHLEEAEALLRQALYLDRTRALAHYHLGLLLCKRGQRGQAAKSFENALELLSRKSVHEALPDSDGLSILDLRSLARMQLDVMKGSARDARD